MFYFDGNPFIAKGFPLKGLAKKEGVIRYCFNTVKYCLAIFVLFKRRMLLHKSGEVLTPFEQVRYEPANIGNAALKSSKRPNVFRG